ncbi:MAG: HNH endonuclease signature motif containing protein [Pirellulaceae bacterium]
MVKSFFQRIKNAVVNVCDPDREDRINRIATKLLRDLRSKRNAFVISECVAGLDLSTGEINDAREIAFRRFLANIWKDGVVSNTELETLLWVEPALEIPRPRAEEIKSEYSVDPFRTALAHAISDGTLTDERYIQLQQISSVAGKTVAAFARKFFLSEGKAFIQAIFIATLEQGEVSEEAWQGLVTTSERLGITPAEQTRLINEAGKRFIEHVLADAKSDQRISTKERSRLEWLMNALQLDGNFCNYVRAELNEIELRHEISLGRLPTIAGPAGTSLRAGEIVHAWSSAEFIMVRMLKSGPAYDEHRGVLTLTDNRLIFQSPTKSQSINYRKFVGIEYGAREIKIQIENKPVWALRIRGNYALFALIMRKAISLANQTSTRLADGTHSRYIPREVRQRVWQRYGGQCVDCSATDYLEFDHIIPVAKGGSNSDSNIQLLCRRCNLKKSDHI